MSTRSGIYYWKCDRPEAFHGTTGFSAGKEAAMVESLEKALRRRFGDDSLRAAPAGGQGNHRTFLTDLNPLPAFVRVEDGPENDDYFDVEAVILEHVRARDVPAPSHLGSDTKRAETPFAWQVLERIPAPDLNQHLKAGRLPLVETAEKIGRLVARWQSIRPGGFGPFDAATARETGALQGLLDRYADYFFLNLDRHLAFLSARNFLSPAQTGEIQAAIARHENLLRLDQGCLVHKDLALWNILGTPGTILAVIDWDDAISGDPLDDISLLGCFYGGDVIAGVLAGYESIRPLPPDHEARFWMHLLRNMIVKAVIRVGAGYFDKKSDFFLIGAGASGENLRAFTQQRIQDALDGLLGRKKLKTL